VLERSADQRGVLRARDVVEVLHRGLNVGVAHPFLDSAEVGDTDDPRAECVAEVVEAQPAERRSLERGAVALRQRGAVEVAARDPDEDQVVVAGEELSLAEPGERLPDLRRHRNRADLAGLRRREVAVRVAGSDANGGAGEVDVSPAERDELALAEAGECCGEEDRCVLLGVRRSDESHDLLGREDLDLRLGRGARLLHVGDRIGRQAIQLPRSLHDAVEDRDRLLPRAICHPAIRVDLVCGPTLDALGSQVLEANLGQVREDVVAEDRVVVAQRRGLAVGRLCAFFGPT
jgi:hypothetical protein